MTEECHVALCCMECSKEVMGFTGLLYGILCHMEGALMAYALCTGGQGGGA